MAAAALSSQASRTSNADSAVMVSSRAAPAWTHALRELLNVPSRAQYDNALVRRHLSAHRRESCPSAPSRDLELFASAKFPFAFFNAAATTDEDASPDLVHPLFAALVLGATRDVVLRLYEACPAALGETTRDGLTPLHLACQHSASVRVVEFLLRHCPSLAHRKSKSGWSTPLHAACSAGAAPEVVRALAVASHSALGVRDRRGNLPLHCAALRRSTGSSCDAAAEVIRLLVALKRNALEIENGMGMRPLHCAALSNSLCLASMRVLADMNPLGPNEAASSVDRSGNSALHFASSHGSTARADVVRALLEYAPCRAAGVNKYGHSPADVARFDASTPREVVTSIVSMARLDSLADDGEAAKLHASLLAGGWAKGADLVLVSRPGLVHRLGLEEVLVPEVALKMERRIPAENNLSALFALIKGVPHLVAR